MTNYQSKIKEFIFQLGMVFLHDTQVITKDTRNPSGYGKDFLGKLWKSGHEVMVREFRKTKSGYVIVCDKPLWEFPTHICETIWEALKNPADKPLYTDAAPAEQALERAPKPMSGGYDEEWEEDLD